MEGKSREMNIGITDSSGNMVNDPAEVRETWRQYIESLYDKDGKPKKEELKFKEEDEVNMDEKGPTVLRSEILSAISEMKEGKAVGVDVSQQNVEKSGREGVERNLWNLSRHIRRRKMAR